MKFNLNHRIGLCLAVIFFITLSSFPVNATGNKLLHDVKINPVVLNISEKNNVLISWNQAYESRMNVLICNIDGRVVRTLMEKVQGSAGSHQVQWDGLDDNGKLCPDNAYIPIIKIKTQGHGNAIYNPSQLPWGERVKPLDLEYNESKGIISYRLPKQGLCLIRVGEKDGGPVYKTILNWEPREAGFHEEPWDGMDKNGIVNAAKKEKFHILLDAFALPEGSILIQNSQTKDYKFNKIKKQFSLYPPQGNNTFLHVYHQRDESHDIEITAELINPVKSDAQIPVIKNTVSFKIMVDEQENIKHLTKEKFEVYLFMDGKLIFEGPEATIPSILKFDTNEYLNGEHVVTINFRTTEDRVGTYSLKVNIEN